VSQTSRSTWQIQTDTGFFQCSFHPSLLRLVEDDTAAVRAISILEFNFLGELSGLGVRLFRQAKAWIPTGRVF
jgi:hypothetical protein